MKKYLDIVVAILLGISSVAVTIGVMVYLVNLQPFAHKADIAKVEQTATAALQTTQTEVKRQDAASALVATAVGKHGEKLKSANERILKNEKDIAELQARVAALRKGQTAQQNQINNLEVNVGR